MDNPFHDEVVAALRALGDPRLGEAIRLDRRSELQYLGVRVPVLRARVKQGFSFSREPDARVLEIWDDLWRMSPFGDVLFAAVEHYLLRRKSWAEPALWQVVRHWSARVENWAHADTLGGLYSRLLERDRGNVYPELQEWNRAEDQWLRRLSLVSLIHYSGKNAVFLTLDEVLPMVANCLDDHRHYVETAVGWVLREMGNAYPSEVTQFLEAHIGEISSAALTRSLERQTLSERSRLRALRNSD